MQLPNRQHATIDRRKLRDYALNPAHPEGRHKARVILSALGLTAADSEWLATTLLQHLGAAEAVLTETRRPGASCTEQTYKSGAAAAVPESEPVGCVAVRRLD